MFRTRKNFNAYKHVPKAGCAFCDRKQMQKIISETKYSMVIENIVPYDVWEMRDVADHLMIIPKRHVASISELSKTERLDIIDLIADYEANGYSLYGRAPENSGRSIEHQHTHLIKQTGRRHRINLVVTKPYFLIKF